MSPDEEDEDDTGKPGFAANDTRDDLVSPAGAAGWKDSTRFNAGEKSFDPNSSSRRRPVVFEEDDDLDVPDFLK
jgi:cell division protein FtsZ